MRTSTLDTCGTQPTFTTNNFYSRTRVHKTPCSPDTFYTSNVLHQTQLKPTLDLLHQKIFTTRNPKTQTHQTQNTHTQKNVNAQTKKKQSQKKHTRTQLHQTIFTTTQKKTPTQKHKHKHRKTQTQKNTNILGLQGFYPRERGCRVGVVIVIPVFYKKYTFFAQHFTYIDSVQKLLLIQIYFLFQIINVSFFVNQY